MAESGSLSIKITMKTRREKQHREMPTAYFKNGWVRQVTKVQGSLLNCIRQLLEQAADGWQNGWLPGLQKEHDLQYPCMP